MGFSHLGLAAVLLLLCLPARAVTFTVGSVGDSHDAVINGTCADASGACTLRAAIEEANATATLGNTIAFNIGSDTPTIQVGSSSLGPLPTITKPVTINGNTGGATRVELNGTLAGMTANGLTISAGGTAVNALVINRFGSSGIVLTANGGNVITNCFIGTDRTGTSALANGANGIFLDGAPSNTIGGTVAGARNLISGNDFEGILIAGSTASDNVVQGNYIGTDVSGILYLSNGGNGVQIDGAPTNTIGGTTNGATNIISANGADGILINGNGATGNLVQGNSIGVDVSGTLNLGNVLDGVAIVGAPYNTIGGTVNFSGNIIANNSVEGIHIQGSSATGNLVQGNFIGTDVTGTGVQGNGDGVFLDGAPGNTVGGTSTAARNIIANNYFEGVLISGSTASGNLVQGNYIGTGVNGTTSLGNQDGVLIDSAPSNTIGGTAAGAGNLISGNGFEGIMITGSSALGNLVQGNYIGTDVSGTAKLPNAEHGVQIDGAPGNTIGGTASGTRNVISGNGDGSTPTGMGVDIRNSGATGNLVQGNYIGVAGGGMAALGNFTAGVRISAGATANTIGGTLAGAGNVIAFNSAAGVSIGACSGAVCSTGNAIQANSIFSNVGLGIDLDPPGVNVNDVKDPDLGANGRQNYPVLAAAVTGTASTIVQGTLNSTPSTTPYTVEFFSVPTCDATGNGEGAVFLGSTTVGTDANGNASFEASLPMAVTVGQAVTATATDPSSNTSEFSACVIVISPVCTCLGDANKNGFVNSSDFTAVQANFGRPADPVTGVGDANCNGFVNASDFAAVQANFGRACP